MLKIEKYLKEFMYIFLIIPYFQVPYLVENYHITNTLYNLYMMLSFFIIACMTINKKGYSKILNYVGFLMIILLFSTFMNSGNLLFCFETIISIFGICLITDYGIRYDKEYFFKALKNFLSILVLINFLSILIFSKGMYMRSTGYIENWILGYKNTHILFIIPCILSNYIYTYVSNKKNIFSSLMLFVGVISTVLVNNTTGLIGLSLIVLFVLFKKIFDNTSIMNVYNYFGVHIVLFISFVILRIQNLFSYIIVDLLHKDITLTGRVYIWDKALDYIKNKPLYGYGNVSFKFNEYIYSTHNAILGILHKVGIIGLIAYIVLVFQAIKKLWENRNTYISKLISIVLFSYLVMMVTEAYAFSYYIYIFVIAYDITFILKGGVSNEKSIAR